MQDALAASKLQEKQAKYANAGQETQPAKATEGAPEGNFETKAPKLEIRKSSCPIPCQPARRVVSRPKTQNLDWSFIFSPNSSRGNQTASPRAPRRKTPQISVNRAKPTMLKLDSQLLTQTELNATGKFLNVARPKSSAFRSARDSDRETTCSSRLSARTSAQDDQPLETDPSMIKVADLLQMKQVLPKSTIRRDMFGNIRAAPRHRIEIEEPTEEFAMTQRKPRHNIESLLDATLYVENVTRAAKSLD